MAAIRSAALIFALAFLMPASAAAQEAEQADPVQMAGNYYEASSVTDIYNKLSSMYDGMMNGNARKEALFGEQGTYGVNHTTGAFEYTYPIDIPHLNWGPQVNLSVHYNSQHGNDFMGMGAYLSGLPKITRDSRFEQSESSTEYFLLDGQKLVKDAAKDYYHCELEDYSYTHCIQETTSSGVTRIDRWETYLKDGTVLTFSNVLKNNYKEEEHWQGQTSGNWFDGLKNFLAEMLSESQIVAMGGALSRWEWPLTEIKDAFGNRVVISYIRAVDCLYPETISYRMKGQDSADSGMQTIEFSYSEREDYYVRRLSEIQGTLKKLDAITVKNPDGKIIKKYQFTYGKKGVTSSLYLRSITESDGMNNKINTVSLSWTRNTLSFGNETELSSGLRYYRQHLLDINGDGFVDLLNYRYYEESQQPYRDFFVRLNNGNSFGENKKWLSVPSIDSYYDVEGIDFFDFNEDGLLDVKFTLFDDEECEHDYIYFKNTGTDFKKLTEKEERNEIKKRSPDSRIDLDGDGLKDSIKVDRNFKITDDKVTKKDYASLGVVQLKFQTNFGFGKYSKENTVNFYNRDNIDFKKINNEEFSGKTDYVDSINYIKDVKFADVNMDGILDLYWTGTGSLEVAYGNKKGFEEKKDTGIKCGKGAIITDINSDGYIDLAEFRDGSLFVKKGTPAAFSVTQVSFSTGNSINVQYKYKKEMTSPSGTISQRGRIKRDPSNQQVVFKIYESDGTGRITNDCSYKYGRSFIYRESEAVRNAVGFEYVQQECKIGESKFIKIKTTYGAGETDIQKKFCAGLPVKIFVFDENYNRYRTVENEYDVMMKNGESIAIVRKKAENTTLYNGGTGEPKYYRKRWEYNIYGDVTASYDYGEVDSTQHDIGKDYLRTEYTYTAVSAEDRTYRYPNLKEERYYGILSDAVDIKTKSLIGARHYYYYTKKDKTTAPFSNPDVTDLKNGLYKLLARVEYYDGELPASPYEFNRKTGYEYDEYGRITAVIDTLGRPVIYEFSMNEGYSALMTSVTDAQGAEENYTYDDCGLVTAVTDRDGHTVNNEYDSFGRMIRTRKENEEITYEYLRDIYKAPETIVQRIRTENGWFRSLKHCNGQGLVLQEKCDAENPEEYRTVSYDYSVSGQLLKVSNPYISTTSNYEKPDWTKLEYTETFYDEMDRAYKVTGADKETTVYTVYAAPNIIMNIDGNGNVSAVKSDCGIQTSWPYVKTISSTDYESIKAECTASALDSSLYHITREDCPDKTVITETGKDSKDLVKDNVITILKDNMGRKTSYIDPDKGTWTYAYDEVGNLAAQTDARGNTITFTYDRLNRPVTKDTADGTTSYEYTRGGLLTKVTYPEGSDTYTYNALDLVTEVTRCIKVNGFDKIKSKHMTYTRAALLSSLTLPDDEKLVYTYTQNGKPLSAKGEKNGSVSDYLTSVKYNAYGAPVKYSFAGNFSFNTEYNLLKRVEKLYTAGMKNSSGLVSDRHLTYSYDGAGNILSKTDANEILSENYAYDERNRLVSSTALNAPERSFTFEYDDFNNITKMVKNSVQKTYEYDDVKVHSLKHVREGYSYKTYSYNENGDVTLTVSPDAAREVEYNASNCVKSMTLNGTDKNKSWNYFYDCDGERIKKSFTDPETGKVMTTVYWFSDYEETYADDTLTKVSKLYDGYAQRVTEYEDSGEVKSDTLEFVFKDILGSPVCTADENGNLKDTFVYEPFGKMLPNENADSLVRSFTGHFAEDDEGLYYCHARWYDADIGRFLQADSILDGFNRYAYCHNNPIGFTDPTGLSRQNPDGTYDYSLGGNPHEGEGSAASGKNKDGDKDVDYLKCAVHKVGANPVAVWAARNGIFPNETLGFSFDPSECVYHTTFDCWQSYGGYNDLYDYFFDLGTSMKPVKFEFSSGNDNYCLWGWKGDYLNLGAGCEVGLYRQDGGLLGDMGHYNVDKNLAMDVKATLFVDGRKAGTYDSKKFGKHWWPAIFNPSCQGKDRDSIHAKYMLTMPNETLYTDFKEKWRKDSRLSNWNDKKHSFTLNY